jgi:3-phytase
MTLLGTSGPRALPVGSPVPERHELGRLAHVSCAPSRLGMRVKELRLAAAFVAALLPWLAGGLLSGCGAGQQTRERGSGPGDSPVQPASRRGGFASTVRPFAETPALVVGEGDEADDVAIHPSGYVIATSKNDRGGLEVYDRRARRRQWLQLGKTNGVDLRGTTVFASNRTRDSVDVLSFTDGRLALVRSFGVPFEPYGLCLFGDTVIVTANGEGRVEQYSLSGRLLRSLSGIRSQSEGCVADDARGDLYIAEEVRGIWKFDAAPTASTTGTLIETVGDRLAPDVEGLAVVAGHLIASSQGDSSLAIYRRDRFVGRVRVAAKGPIDRVTKTDGLDANAALDLLVVHDNSNAGGKSSNYKFVELSRLFPR